MPGARPHGPDSDYSRPAVNSGVTAEVQWVLASASPARLGVLRSVGIEPIVVVSHVDETTESGSAREVALALARRKAETVAAQLPASGRSTVVLGCDSVLEFAGQTFGKPHDAAEATERWKQMRGNQGQLHTGHCLLRLPNSSDGSPQVLSQVATTTIYFADASDDEIARYVATGEPLRVAGGFTIDGRGGWLVERINGDHTNVIGLSLPTVRAMLEGLGLAVPFG